VAPVAPATSRPCLAVVQYDGAQFVGWQRQREGRTVQADFEAVLERLMGRRTPTTGAGRTDTGVHALGQGVGFAAAGRWSEDADGLRRALAPLHRRYAGVIHARRKRTGHFWQGRFGCVAMDEAHLAAALRYVSLNPVRARLVDRARAWRWSIRGSWRSGRG